MKKLIKLITELFGTIFELLIVLIRLFIVFFSIYLIFKGKYFYGFLLMFLIRQDYILETLSENIGKK